MNIQYLLLALAGFVALPAHAEGIITEKQSLVLKQLVANYAEKAKKEDKNTKSREGIWGDKPFSAEVGREFFLKRRSFQANDYTCSGCHTKDPTKEGKHIETKKPIKPLAPSANPERFTDTEKVEKNFTEHCNDLYKRDCRAYEKGNFITYLISIK